MEMFRIFQRAHRLSLVLQAIALQTRHILDEMNSKGHVIDSIYMSGKTFRTKWGLGYS
jgi:ribulose kinase